MPRSNKVEHVYLDSARKLRASLPKSAIFIGAAALVWLFGTSILIPLGQGIFVYGTEASKIINLILIVAIFVMIATSFREIREVADAAAGFVTYFVGNGKKVVEETRLHRLKKTFRNFAYVILAAIVFLMFKPILDGIHPALAGIVLVLISIWSIISLYAVVMAMSSEIEEAAVHFSKNLEKEIRKKKK